ncbi:MAG: phytoene desaturase family protein [Dermatophilaceae bacterium]
MARRVKVLVVGAGLSGLAAACHLAGRGYDVRVLERESEPGGRAGSLSLDGYRFDTGPVVMTMPHLLYDPIRALGADPADHVRMTQLDPAYRAVYADGSEILVRAAHEAMREQIAATCGRHDAAGFDRFTGWLARLYDVEMATFIERNYTSPLDLVASPLAAARLLRLGGLRRLAPAVSSFFQDERLTRLFSFQALYAGVAPQHARALFAVITYMDTVGGVFFPEGGMRAVPHALAGALTKAGVPIDYGVTVTEVLRRGDGAVAGVRTADEEALAADAVVCTLDLPVAYDHLLPGVAPPRRAVSGSYSPSALVWHVGVKGVPGEGIRHHNIHFGTEWAGAFEALIDRGELMPDPSRLVSVPSVSDPSLAPPGHSTLYVLEPVPNLAGRVDWATAGGPMRERLADFLGRAGYPDDIRAERLVTPLDWAADGLHLGTPFALAHTFGQSGPFRPRNIDPRVPGLVFAGSGTTPGVGVPMVLISGRLAADRVSAYLRESR